MKRILPLLLSLAILVGMLPLGLLSVSADDGEETPSYRIVISDATVTFEGKNEIFTGTAKENDILVITSKAPEGRTFQQWKDFSGFETSESSFRLLVTRDTYLYPVYTDTADYEFSTWEVVQEGNCEEGVISKRTNSAGDVEYKITFSNYGQHTFNGDPVYVDEGHHKYVCSVCGYESVEEHVTYGDYEVIKEATHDTTGLLSYTCPCGYQGEEVIPVTETHSFANSTWTIVEKSENGNYGKRSRTCDYCDYTETYWYLDCDLESYLRGKYVRTVTKSYGATTHDERLYNYVREDGKEVWVWALQFGTWSGANDSRQTFLLMFVDDGDENTLKPIYISKSNGTDTMSSYLWAHYGYAHNVNDWLQQLRSLDWGSTVAGGTWSNRMSARDSSLVSYYDDWAEKFNAWMIPASEDLEDYFTPDDEYSWKTEGDGQIFGVYQDESDPSTYYGGIQTRIYSRNTGSYYESYVIDQATGITVSMADTSSRYSFNFTEMKDIKTAAEYEALSDLDKQLCISQDTILDALKSFCSQRTSFSNLTLEEPETISYIRVTADVGTVSASSSYNPASVYAVGSTLSLSCSVDDGYEFVCWEKWDPETESWKFYSSKLNPTVQTSDSPLKACAYFRPVMKKAEPITETVHVTITGGYFDDHQTDADVVRGSEIQLYATDIPEGKELDHWEDGDGIEYYSNLWVYTDTTLTPVYADCTYSIYADGYNGHGYVWFGEDEGTSTYASKYDVPYGTVLTLTTKASDEDYTEFLGWYLAEYDEMGTSYTRVSKKTTLTLTANDDSSYADYLAVWSDGTVSMEPETVSVHMKSGFVQAERLSYGVSPLCVSDLDCSAYSPLVFLDDPKDNVRTGSWNVKYNDGTEDVTENYEVDFENGGVAYYYLQNLEQYASDISVEAVPVTPCTEHTWSEFGTEIQKPTHTVKGKVQYTCTVCGETKTEDVECTSEHTFGDWTKQDDTKHVRTCECGETETGDHTWDDGEITTPATHTEKGVKTYTCTLCGATKTDDVECTSEHTFGDWTKQDDTKHVRTCECGETETGDHTWDDGEITTPATHTVKGIKTYTCTVCGATKTEEIECTAEHEFGEWYPQDDSKHMRTCECGETETEDHSWDNGEITTPATHTVKGVKTYVCTVCGTTRTEEVERTTDHEFGSWTSQDDTKHVRTCACGETETEDHTWDDGKITKESTTTEQGVKTYTCTVCGATKTEVLPLKEEETVAGDIDGNGKIEAKDYLKLKRCVLSTYDATDEEYQRMDINKDGQVNAKDYIMLKRVVLGTYVLK